MKSHKDIAIDALSKQKRLLDHDIREMERERASIEGALTKLIGQSMNGHRQNDVPTAAESARRRDVVVEFCNAWAGTEFTPDEFMDQTREPYRLRAPFIALLNNMAEEGHLIKLQSGKGKRQPVYKAKETTYA